MAVPATLLTAPVERSYSFPKEEHLCRKKLIEELFGRGSSFGLYPLRLVWLPAEARTAAPPQVLVSVSKRGFKRAVDRNYLKRLLREAYRLNKYHLTEAEGGHPVGLLAIIYTGKEKKPFTLVEKKLISGLERLLTGAPPQPGKCLLRRVVYLLLLLLCAKSLLWPVLC